MKHAPPAALFLFAHQDDEFGVFQHILACRTQGQPVACAYLTDGQTPAGAGAAIRNGESLAVLARLGVAASDVRFAGQELGIADASLPLHLERAAGWIGRWLDGFPAIGALHVTAWEGGHQDHDALHALAVTLAAERGLLARTRQFPLYQAKGLMRPLLRVLAPLPENGPAEALPIPWRTRPTHLRACLSYPSQRNTWLHFFPLVLLHYLLCGVELQQQVAPRRLRERPHPGALYYEQRRFFTWTRMQALVAAFLAARGSPLHPTT